MTRLKSMFTKILIVFAVIIPTISSATVNISSNNISYNCNGVLTTFTYPFEILDTSSIQAVTKSSAGVESTLTLNSDYTVTGAGSVSGGTVVLSTGSKCPSGSTISLIRNTNLLQEVDYVDGGALSAESLENALDKHALTLQDHSTKLSRALSFPRTGDAISNEILGTEFENRANHILGFNSSGNLATFSASSGITTIQTYALVSSYASLDAAVAAIGGANTILLLDEASDCLNNLTIPANIEIKTMPGNAITIASGKTLTINSPFEAGRYQVFAGSGAVTFGQGTSPNVLSEWWGAVGDGVADDTVAIKAALAAAKNNGVLYLSNKTYLITDTLTLYRGQNIKGIKPHHRAYSKDGPFATTIKFAPTSEKDLFYIAYNVAVDGGAYTSHVTISDMFLEGNTTGGVTHSRYALDVNRSDRGKFENISISKFQTGVHCLYTIKNEFINLLIINCSVAALHYDTGPGISTTDDWVRCYFGTSPWGAIIEYAVGVKFTNCLLESLSVGGVDIWKESWGIEWTGGYGEDVPSTNTSTLNCFQVGVNGTTPVVGAEKLKIIGGVYGGRNAGAVGAFIDVDYANRITILGTNLTRYSYGVRSTANTDSYALFVSGITYQTVATLFSDITKVNGEYLTTDLNGSKGPRIRTSRVIANTVETGTLYIGNTVAGDVTATAKSRKMEIFDTAGTSLGFIQVYAGP